MASLRFTDVQARPTEFLDLTSLTLDEFQQLVPPFEAAFQAHMAAWRLDGKPRTARQFSVYKNCPLPTPEDRLLFILAYLKTYCPPSRPGTPVRHGPEQSQSVDSRPLARAAGGAAHPRRCPDPLPDGAGAAARRRGGRRGHGGHAAGGGASTRRRRPAAAPSPLLPMTGPNGASSAPKTLLNRRRVIAARKRTTRSKMSCWSMPCSPSSF